MPLENTLGRMKLVVELKQNTAGKGLNQFEAARDTLKGKKEPELEDGTCPV